MRLPILNLLLSMVPAVVLATESRVEIHAIDSHGDGQLLGTVAIRETAVGIELVPELKGLPPGGHGFHVHEKASCAPGEKDGQLSAGLAAGNHYDPEQTGRHLGPDAPGHKGDLPQLTVAPDGTAKVPVSSTRLRLKDLKGRSLIIHGESDNYADRPGGPRIACGIID